MDKKDDFIVSFMISLQEYQKAKREYFISCCKDFKVSEQEMNDALKKMDLFDRAEEHELLNTIQCFYALNDFDCSKYIKEIHKTNDILTKISIYSEKYQLKRLKKYNRLATWIRFKNFWRF